MYVEEKGGDNAPSKAAENCDWSFRRLVFDAEVVREVMAGKVCGKSALVKCHEK